MKANAMFNFHLPLPPELHRMLREEAERTGQAATTLAREALSAWLRRRRKAVLHAEISAYAKAAAGTHEDLDPDLEAAGIEAIAEGDP
jgi:hypothetical protein